ncbi:alpha/beta hydrolase [Actinospongicola halichondriae]|uniref:alpha/beta hydrolase n=1 Tax=Actinospongicola halichondriae TaxID=3236844 RepID=UPI003D577003
MNERFTSGSLTLVGHLAGAPAEGMPRGPRRAAVVLVHGYPSGPSGTAGAVSAMPELADRIADNMEIIAFSPCLRGMAGSEGDFSIRGWADDVHAAVAHVRATTNATSVWLVGFGTGGALAICAGADDPEIGGVAALAAPADFDDWASNPRQLFEHARELGITSVPARPAAIEGWTRELRALRAVDGAQRISPRSLLVIHGSDDDVVPSFDARVIADAHTEAELHLLEGAGHRLRHDPRAMAITLGWLDRQRTAAVPRTA